jgi:hypothetical protein
MYNTSQRSKHWEKGLLFVINSLTLLVLLFLCGVLGLFSLDYLIGCMECDPEGRRLWETVTIARLIATGFPLIVAATIWYQRHKIRSIRHMSLLSILLLISLLGFSYTYIHTAQQLNQAFALPLQRR